MVLTCVVWLERQEEQLYSFHARRRLRPSSCLSGKPKIRLPSTKNTIPVPEPRQLPGLQPHTKQYHNILKYICFWSTPQARCEDRPKSTEISPLGQNYGDLTKFRFTAHNIFFEQNNGRDEPFAAPNSNIARYDE